MGSEEGHYKEGRKDCAEWQCVYVRRSESASKRGFPY